jgi:hypothetical protein
MDAINKNETYSWCRLRGDATRRHQQKKKFHPKAVMLVLYCFHFVVEQ